MHAKAMPRARLLILAVFALLAALAVALLMARGHPAHPLLMHFHGKAAMHFHGGPHLAALPPMHYFG